MIVVDASVLATALGDDGDEGRLARARLRDERLVAPELIDLKVASVLGRHGASGQMCTDRADRAIADLAALPMTRVPHRALLARCCQLRHNMTVYDAAYVSLAESIGAMLVTSDERLAGAPGARCEFEILRTRT